MCSSGNTARTKYFLLYFIELSHLQIIYKKSYVWEYKEKHDLIKVSNTASKSELLFHIIKLTGSTTKLFFWLNGFWGFFSI